MPSVPLIDLIAAAQSGDRLISFPTDTLPALAVRPDRASLIFAAKQRSLTKPLILMGAEATDLWQYVQGSRADRAIWQQIADRYWPGALTLVLPASDRLPPEMNPTDPTTLGLRVPCCAIACHILAQTQPLATTSVNRSGEPPLQTVAEINAQFPEVLTLLPQDIPDGDSNQTFLNKSSSFSQGQPSTVVKWTGEGWTVLRQGQVKFEA
ncbi:MAG: L-threonylcarbamoyladenylate synthase [Drouetiella hepatica Uher 2000/2452]|jgi:L-threonylcarbamoyladenylate synthase|uniref:L-threonylcarbamoyladenylate synthase n=1 Tax=Drouetiella hepatica Uher 2000/2452 TaxID=904376 RepID=A0A951ULS4_9CYAN|nr:L-threonylcarbamoyladenylate synthase [Drouetiella hepatica Uher 2000/2452]